MQGRFAAFDPLFAAFTAAGHELYLVGGCVRDVVMGSDRVGDIDLATSALPAETTAVLEGAGFRSYPIGERFGTITTTVSGATVEITTYRVGETYRAGSRHPEVQFGKDIAADLGRRDLSINAMAMGQNGEIVDPFGGRTAIAERKLEVPGGGYENTISILADDPLRLLRTARFAARFGFEPTDATTRAARETAGDLSNISAERWKMEMDKLLVSPHLEVGLGWLLSVGGLAVISPPCAGLGDASTARLCARLAATPADPVARWAVLLLSALGPFDWMAVGATPPTAEARKRTAQEHARRFRFSNHERASLTALLGHPLTRETLLGTWTLPDLRRHFVAAPRAALMQFDVAAALADEQPEVARAAVELKNRSEELLETGDPTPRLPKGLGSRIGSALDLDGPGIGAALQVIREAILDGRVQNDGAEEIYLNFLKSEPR